MTTTYLAQTSELTLTQLKKLAQAWGVVPQGDKRKKQTWVAAIDQKRRELVEPAPVRNSEISLSALQSKSRQELAMQLSQTPGTFSGRAIPASYSRKKIIGLILQMTEDYQASLAFCQAA